MDHIESENTSPLAGATVLPAGELPDNKDNIFLRSLDELTVEDVAPGRGMKRRKKSVAGVARALLISVCVVVFIICMIELVDILDNYKRADRLYDDISAAFNSAGLGGSNGIMSSLMAASVPDAPLGTYSAQKVSGTNGTLGGQSSLRPAKSVEFQRKLAYLELLRDENPDTYGFIVIDGTNISYPVVQSADNSYYLKRGFNGSQLSTGTIFADFRNDRCITENKNVVLYGHNMLNGSMFHDIAKYDRDFPGKYGVRYDGSEYGEDFFSSHRYIKLYTFDGIYTFEVFSFYETTERDRYFTTNFASDEEFLAFCDRAISRSQYDAGITMTAEDVMITLSTCVNLSPSGRYACHAKLIKIEN